MLLLLASTAAPFLTNTGTVLSSFTSPLWPPSPPPTPNHRDLHPPPPLTSVIYPFNPTVLGWGPVGFCLRGSARGVAVSGGVAEGCSLYVGHWLVQQQRFSQHIVNIFFKWYQKSHFRTLHVQQHRLLPNWGPLPPPLRYPLPPPPSPPPWSSYSSTCS